MKKNDLIVMCVFAGGLINLFANACNSNNTNNSGSSDTDSDSGSDTDSDDDTIPYDSYEGSDCLIPVSNDKYGKPEELHGDLECLIWEKNEKNQLILSIKGYKPSSCDSLEKKPPILLLKSPNEIAIKNEVMEEDCTCCFKMGLSISQLNLDKNVSLTLITDYLTGYKPDDGYESEEWSITLRTSSETDGVECRYPDRTHPRCRDDIGLHSLCSTEQTELNCPSHLECIQPMDGRTNICMKPCAKDNDCQMDFTFCGKDGYCIFEETL